MELGSDPCHRNRFAYQAYYVAQEWNYWETAEVIIEAMGHRYEKVAPFSFPRAPRGTQKPRPSGSAGNQEDSGMNGGDELDAEEVGEEEAEEEEEDGVEEDVEEE